MTEAASSALLPDPANAAPEPPSGISHHRQPLRFTGTGSEYFRIWIVNLLLTVVTLGIYWPFAKLRRLKYFHANTHLDGHAFAFLGNGWAMLRGSLLVVLMLGLYSLAGRWSPGAGLSALVVLVAVWPALYCTALRFRLGNTQWRGLRFRFTGRIAQAYSAMLPFFLPALAVVALTLRAGSDGAVAPRPAAPGLGFGVAMLAWMLAFPWLLWRLERFQRGHYALGVEEAKFEAPLRSLYAIAVKSLLLALLFALVSGLIVGVTGAPVGGGMKNKTVLTVVMLVVIYAPMLFIALPYWITRFQNLSWNHTRSPQVWFESRLLFWPFARLTAKNGLLTLLTIGLYWPFAKVAMARMRLEAVTVCSAIPLDAFASASPGAAGGAAGDAAGDLFGIDFGL